MTTELEQEFFKTFGIEKINKGCDEYYYVPEAISCKECEDKYCLEHLEYPEITAEKFLELICIHNIYLVTKLYSLEVKDLKDKILQDLIDEKELREIKKDYVNDELKHQVRALFGGEE